MAELRLANNTVEVLARKVCIKDLRDEFIVWLSYEDVEILTEFLNKHKETLKTHHIKELEKQRDDLYVQFVLIEKELNKLKHS